MSIEKSPYNGQKGINLVELEAPLDIDIEPEIVENEDGSVVVDLSGDTKPSESPEAQEHDANLAEFMTDEALATLGTDLCADVEDDLRSRADWEKTYKDGMRLLGLKIEHRTEPWDGACGVVHPLMTEAVVRFQAELITETFPAAGPVKAKILGRVSREKEEAAARVRDDLNIEITDRMTEYRGEHERLLWNLPIAGSALKKVYYDPTLGRQTSMFVPAEDFIVAYGASELASCTRYAHKMKKTKNDLKKLMTSGFYRDVDLVEPTEHTDEIKEAKDKIAGQTVLNNTEHYTLYEVNVDLHLPGFEDALGIALPYVVTIDKDSETVLSVRRNWKEDDEQRKKRQYFVHYQYIPGFGFYGLGLIHLVGGFAESATSILRQLVDSGTLSNLPGGLKTRGLRIKGDDTPIGPGEWRDVDVPGGTLKENLLPLPYKEPSLVLAGLLDKIVEEGRKFAAVAEMKVADFDSNSPVGTTMALLERTLKVMSAVQARVYEAMKYEFRLIKEIIRDHGADEYEYEPETGDRTTRKADYELVDVMPVADPNSATMSQRIVQWQAVMQLAAAAPQIYDLPELHAQMLDILGVKNVDKLIPTRKDNSHPTDPITENMAILNGKPVKAFMEQDHMSHIAVHQAAMQDPKLMAMVGQNPMAQQIQAAAMAHLMEHTAFEYRNQIQKMLGTTLPHPDEKLPPEVEVQLSALVAQASQKLLGMNQNEAAKAEAEKQAQDPVLQQQMAETRVKEGDLERKVLLDKEEIRLRELELKLREKEIDLNAAAKGATIGQNAVMHKEKMAAEEGKAARQESAATKQAGFKAVVDAVHKQEDRDFNRQEKERDRQLQERVAEKTAKANAKPTKKADK